MAIRENEEERFNSTISAHGLGLFSAAMSSQQPSVSHALSRMSSSSSTLTTATIPSLLSTGSTISSRHSTATTTRLSAQMRPASTRTQHLPTLTAHSSLHTAAMSAPGATADNSTVSSGGQDHSTVSSGGQDDSIFGVSLRHGLTSRPPPAMSNSDARSLATSRPPIRRPVRQQPSENALLESDIDMWSDTLKIVSRMEGLRGQCVGRFMNSLLVEEALFYVQIL